MADTNLAGGCQCGDVRYALAGEPMFAAICHCTMYRKAHAAPAVAWAMYQQTQVVFPNKSPKQFESSKDAQRGFCARCGTQISFTASFLPGLIDISIGSLDEPGAITPSLHYRHSKHLSWAEFADDLPRHAELPPFGESEG